MLVYKVAGLVEGSFETTDTLFKQVLVKESDSFEVEAIITLVSVSTELLSECIIDCAGEYKIMFKSDSVDILLAVLLYSFVEILLESPKLLDFNDGSKAVWISFISAFLFKDDSLKFKILVSIEVVLSSDWRVQILDWSCEAFLFSTTEDSEFNSQSRMWFDASRKNS